MFYINVELFCLSNNNFMLYIIRYLKCYS